MSFDTAKHLDVAASPESRGARIYDMTGGDDVDSATSDSASFPSWVQLRPILVGYAFGPKKMSTMGITLAEASKALSTVATAAVPVSRECSTEESHGCVKGPHHSPSGFPFTSTNQSIRTGKLSPSLFGAGKSIAFEDSRDKLIACMAPQDNTVGHWHTETRLFESGESSIVSVTESTTSGSLTSTTRTSVSSLALDKSVSSHTPFCLRPIRVSFVPLDLDSPLEEQHGGKFDVILHKLTEDILCLSKIPMEARQKGSVSERSDGVRLREAIVRVNRLNQYKQRRPQCCLIDHPSNVEVLMSRADIALHLSDCLIGVKSASGIPIGTPRFEIVENVDTENVSRIINRSSLNYPLISKPLTAAGTAESHRMAVVLDSPGLAFVKSPCLLQEYANHDSILFKVYVLGDTVHVFQRPSLPNLPPARYFRKNKRFCSRLYVEFDSQRPYPTLVDFGVVETDEMRIRGRKRRRRAPSSTCNEIPEKERHCSFLSVTADEIRPLVEVLKLTFGLELFGFDILLTDFAEGGRRDNGIGTKMLVVDVNYFPSYKEVTNFPSLLAQYLTQRAIQDRIRSLNMT